MASASHLMKKMNLGTGKVGLTGLVVDGAVAFGAGYGIGQVHNRYRDKWYGKHAPRLAAAGGKLLAIGLVAMGHGGMAAGIANGVGSAGLAVMGADLGLKHAAKAMGKKAVFVPSGTDINKISGATEMGALGRAAPGRGLSWDQIEELAAGH